MEFSKCVQERRSIRNFKKERIPHDKFNEIVKLASFSPSWKNSQIVEYTVIENDKIKNTIANSCVMDFEFNSKTIKNAPALIVVKTITKRSGYERDGSFATAKGDSWGMFDAGVASQTLCLAAHSKGLGTVILGIFDENKIGKLIELPENQKIAALVAIGFPVSEVAMPKRKELDELISFI